MTPSTPAPNSSPIIPIADGVAIWDVSAQMPWHPTKRYPKRRKAIRRIYVHHSGARGLSGVDGAIASADYAIDKRGDEYASINYHYWLGEDMLYDSEGRELLLRTQPHEVVCYHTGGLNTSGIGIALQGNKNREPLTPAQEHGLDALLMHLLKIPTLDAKAPIGWHSVAHLWGGKRKVLCPGKHTEQWLREWLHSRALPIPGEELLTS